MEIDRKKLEALDEKSLADLIYRVVRAMGLSDERARKMAANAPSVRLMLLKASDRDLAKIVTAVGEKRAGEILSAVEKKN